MSAYADAEATAQIVEMVGKAERAFRERWRMTTLERVDAELHEAVKDQQRLYDAAMLTGTRQEMKLQAEAMVRGWRAAIARMEAQQQPDDAYLIGVDAGSQLAVIISDYVGAGGPYRLTSEGKRIIQMTPDEIAKVMAGLEMIVKAKLAFPECEIEASMVGDYAAAEHVIRRAAEGVA